MFKFCPAPPQGTSAGSSGFEPTSRMLVEQMQKENSHQLRNECEPLVNIPAAAVTSIRTRVIYWLRDQGSRGHERSLPDRKR